MTDGPTVAAEIRAKIRGSPAEFVVMAMDFADTIDLRRKAGFSYVGKFPPPVDLSSGKITFDGGDATALILPEGETQLTVRIHDAMNTPEIWRLFEAEMAKLEWIVSPSAQVEKPPLNSDEIDLPKTKKTRLRHARAYALILDLREEYKSSFDDWTREDPKPTLDDYRDALASSMDWRPSHRTISKIIREGDAGKLNHID